eukprot:m.31583 g.31583  ORF g.31583 m.31583 type:complete len:272 (+) comp6318_c0_seq5:87-902(+)
MNNNNTFDGESGTFRDDRRFNQHQQHRQFAHEGGERGNVGFIAYEGNRRGGERRGRGGGRWSRHDDNLERHDNRRFEGSRRRGREDFHDDYHDDGGRRRRDNYERRRDRRGRSRSPQSRRRGGGRPSNPRSSVALVKNLPFEATSNDLSQLLQSLGARMTDARVISDRQSGNCYSPCCHFIPHYMMVSTTSQAQSMQEWHGQSSLDFLYKIPFRCYFPFCFYIHRVMFTTFQLHSHPHLHTPTHQSPHSQQQHCAHNQPTHLSICSILPQC